MAIKTWEKETLPVYIAKLGDHPWTASLLHAIGDAYKDLAMRNKKSGYVNKAESMFKEALEIQTKLLKNHLDTARSHVCLSDVLRMKGKLQSALEECKKGLEIREGILGPDHDKTKSAKTKIEDLEHELRGKNSLFSPRNADLEKGITNKANSELSLRSFNQKAIE